MEKIRNRTFKKLYIIFVIVLTVLMAASIVYIRGLLVGYENSQPELQAANALDMLKQDAENQEEFWSKYALPSVNDEIKSEYFSLLSSEGVTFSSKGTTNENSMSFIAKHNGFPIAEIALKATGEAETKLVVFNMRNWQIETYKPIFEKKTYNIVLPEGFIVSLDGKKLSKKEAQTSAGKYIYALPNVYLLPEIKIEDSEKNSVEYFVQGNKIIPNIYEETLVLPASIKVAIDKKSVTGKTLSDGRKKYDIVSIKKPSIILKDIYDNIVDYDGKNLPLTYCKIDTPKGYTVKLEGKKLPKSAVTTSVPDKYAVLDGVVENLPVQTLYEVAILKENAKIKVYDASNKEIKLSGNESEYSFYEEPPQKDTVPKEISEKVDVLKVAQNWSLFMSNDLSFASLEPSLLTESYQYNVAKQYNNSVDRTFFSKHTLGNPAFEKNKVTNFTQISEDSFSVEISFVKNIRLSYGKLIKDEMNDGFYFVYRDNKWLLAGLKEVEKGGK